MGFKNFINVFFVFALLFIAQISFAQQQPVDFKRNDAGQATLSVNTPNLGIAYGGVGNRGDVLTSKAYGQYACSAANTGTTAVDIIASLAGTARVVSLVKCYNNTTVASIISLRKATTVIGTDLIGTNALSNANKVVFDFTEAPVLVPGGSSLNFIMTTNATSTVCCANYQNAIYVTPTPTPTNTPTSTPTATATPTRTPTPTP